jgi:hypothetical protein
MKTITVFFVFGFASICCLAQAPPGTGRPPEATTKATYLVIYRPGPAWLTGKSVMEQPLKEH